MGKPSTRRREAGKFISLDWRVKRDALSSKIPGDTQEAELKLTGEPCETETLMRGLGSGGWKHRLCCALAADSTKFTSLERDTIEIRRNSPSVIDNSLE